MEINSPTDNYWLRSSKNPVFTSEFQTVWSRDVFWDFPSMHSGFLHLNSSGDGRGSWSQTSRQTYFAQTVWALVRCSCSFVQKVSENLTNTSAKPQSTGWISALLSTFELACAELSINDKICLRPKASSSKNERFVVVVRPRMTAQHGQIPSWDDEVRRRERLGFLEESDSRFLQRNAERFDQIQGTIDFAIERLN